MMVKEKSSGPWQGPELATNTLNYEHNVTTVLPSRQLHGVYPTKPPHDCKNSAYATSDGRDLALHKRTERRWRKSPSIDAVQERCEACLYERAWRFCKQIEHEYEQGELLWTALPDKEIHQKMLTKLRVRKHRGQFSRMAVFPQADGTYVWIHDQPDVIGEGEPVPTNRKELFCLMVEWADTPHGTKHSNSKGWGGAFQGTQAKAKKNPGRKVEVVINMPDQNSLVKALKEADFYDEEPTLVGFAEVLHDHDVPHGVEKGFDRLEEALAEHIAKENGWETITCPDCEHTQPKVEGNWTCVECGVMHEVDVESDPIYNEVEPSDRQLNKLFVRDYRPSYGLPMTQTPVPSYVGVQ